MLCAETEHVAAVLAPRLQAILGVEAREAERWLLHRCPRGHLGKAPARPLTEADGCYREPRPFDAASRRRAFCTDGNAALAFANGRARTSTLAGLAAIVIS